DAVDGGDVAVALDEGARRDGRHLGHGGRLPPPVARRARRSGAVQVRRAFRRLSGAARHHRRVQARLVALLVIAAVALAGCGGSKRHAAPAPATTAAPVTTAAPATTARGPAPGALQA